MAACAGIMFPAGQGLASERNSPTQSRAAAASARYPTDAKPRGIVPSTFPPLVLPDACGVDAAGIPKTASAEWKRAVRIGIGNPPFLQGAQVGSGVLLGPGGHVLTASHVVQACVRKLDAKALAAFEGGAEVPCHAGTLSLEVITAISCEAGQAKVERADLGPVWVAAATLYEGPLTDVYSPADADARGSDTGIEDLAILRVPKLPPKAAAHVAAVPRVALASAAVPAKGTELVAVGFPMAPMLDAEWAASIDKALVLHGESFRASAARYEKGAMGAEADAFDALRYLHANASAPRDSASPVLAELRGRILNEVVALSTGPRTPEALAAARSEMKVFAALGQALERCTDAKRALLAAYVRALVPGGMFVPGDSSLRWGPAKVIAYEETANARLAGDVGRFGDAGVFDPARIPEIVSTACSLLDLRGSEILQEATFAFSSLFLALSGEIPPQTAMGSLAVYRASVNELRGRSGDTVFNVRMSGGGGFSGGGLFDARGALVGLVRRAEKTFVEGYEFVPHSVEATNVRALAAFLARTDVKRRARGLAPLGVADGTPAGSSAGREGNGGRCEGCTLTGVGNCCGD